MQANYGGRSRMIDAAWHCSDEYLPRSCEALLPSPAREGQETAAGRHEAGDTRADNRAGGGMVIGMRHEGRGSPPLGIASNPRDIEDPIARRWIVASERHEPGPDKRELPSVWPIERD